MLGFALGIVLGAVIGILIAALFAAAKMNDELMITRDDTYYKCKTNPIEACKDDCCYFCGGASYCKYACKAHPSTCGMSVIKEWEKEQQWD